jgi:hypothetical protein
VQQNRKPEYSPVYAVVFIIAPVNLILQRVFSGKKTDYFNETPAGEQDSKNSEEVGDTQNQNKVLDINKTVNCCCHYNCRS